MQTTSNVLDYAEQPDVFSTKEQASRCMSVIEEQQDSVKQLVIWFITRLEYKLFLNTCPFTFD